MGAKESTPISCSIPISEPSDTESAIYRHPLAQNKLRVTTDPTVATVYEGLQHNFKRCTQRNFLGKRSKSADGEYGAYSFLTYLEVDLLSAKLGGFLNKVCPWVDVNGIEIATIGIWMRGGVEWVLTDIGAERYSIATVPIHDSLQEPYIAKVLQDAKVHALVACSTVCERLVSVLKKYDNYV